jgi:tetratricopeptide (TPR) repeat protein
VSRDDERLIDVAGAILDGTAVDWDAAASAAAPAERPIIVRLKAIATVARACRTEKAGTWGPLRILEPIGHGTFGEVFRAWDARLDRDVALKLLPIENDATAGTVSSIIEEGRLLARVRHPNVVTIHGAERIGDRVGLWMEYVNGRTLQQLVIEDGRRFSPTEVVSLGRALCGAVDAVHAAGLLHRDIKAQNVMVAVDGRVVLMDFGAGRERGQAASATLTGTPLYLAPEVLTGGAAPSVAADVYSIGVLLYFLLTRSFPVVGASLDELRAAHVNGDRRFPDQTPDLPRSLRRTIARAIDPDPACRFASAGELAGALEHRAIGRRTAWTSAAVAALALLAAGAARWVAAPARAELDTYGLYVEARALAERQGTDDPLRAVTLFEQIIASNQEYAPAHAGLVLAYAYLSMTPYQGLSFQQAHGAMRAAAIEAIRLDPSLAEAQAARAWVHARELEWDQAERSFRRAIALNPRLVFAYTSLSFSTLQPLGRAADAERLLRDAERIAPASAEVQRELGRVLLQDGRPAEAIAVLEPLRDKETGLPFVELTLARALTLAGRAEESLPILERRRQRLMDPTDAPDPWLSWAYVALDRRADAEQLARDYDHLPFRRAIINGALGRADRMFHGLEEMFGREPQRLALLLRAPELAAYRSDARFHSLLRRLNLTAG